LRKGGGAMLGSEIKPLSQITVESEKGKKILQELKSCWEVFRHYSSNKKIAAFYFFSTSEFLIDGLDNIRKHIQFIRELDSRLQPKIEIPASHLKRYFWWPYSFMPSFLFFRIDNLLCDLEVQFRNLYEKNF
jgi:hypothetical protein